VGQSAELVTVEVTRHDLNRLKALAKGLGWPAKQRQATLNTVFGFGLDAAEELLSECQADNVTLPAQRRGRNVTVSGG
jgi:hypothetical protein